jgi:hypothetical protein
MIATLNTRLATGVGLSFFLSRAALAEPPSLAPTDRSRLLAGPSA